MSGGNEKQGGEAASPELPSLSVGFWDAFASGLPWTEPVLAVLSCSPVGADYQLILATDGSVRKENKLRKPRARSSKEQAYARQVQEPHETEEAEPQDRLYQHGRLLVQRKTITCKPELLVNRIVSLLVYARCPIKGRLTPVVTDLQLFPGQWTRPTAAFVSHPLYAPDPNAKRSCRASGAGRLEDSVADGASADSLNKRSRSGNEGGPSGTSSPARSPVYNRSRGGPVAKVQRGVRTALADLHLYSHHWEVLARVSYKLHNPFPHEVEIKFDATAQVEEAEDEPSIPFQKGVKIPWFVRSGARVTEYAGRACLSSTTQMQICSFSGEQSTSKEPNAAVPISLQGSGGLCGVSNDQVDVERRWWHSEGGRLGTACVKCPANVGFQALKEIALEAQRLLQEDPGSTKNFRTIASVFDLLGGKFGVSDVQAEGAEGASFCLDNRRLQMQQVPLRGDPGAEVAAALNSSCAEFPCSSELFLDDTWEILALYGEWMLSLKLADFSGTLNCVALGDQGQVVDTTAEGLSKLESGGVDTRGRTFASILEQLSFAEFELQLTAKCDVYKEDKTVQLMVRGASWVAANVYAQVARNVELTERLLAGFCPSQAAP
ncbi:hypothetical protein Emag_002428 [Eimeria magna]